MKKYIFFIFSIIASSTPYFYAMETEKKENSPLSKRKSRTFKELIPLSKDLDTKEFSLTTINNGLKTTIPGKIAHVSFCGESGQITSTKIAIWQAPLATLVKHKKQLSLRTAVLNPVLEIFSPLVLKESKKNNGQPFFIDLGLFNHQDQKYKEALKAIKDNKALYCAYGQGAIIYNPEKQPDPNNYKEINSYIIQDTRLQPQK